MTSDPTEYQVDDVCAADSHEKPNDSYCNEEALEGCQSLWQEAIAVYFTVKSSPKTNTR